MATVTEMQARLRKVLDKAERLTAKAGLTGDEAARLDGLLKEGEELRQGLERAERLKAIGDWAGQRQPLPPLAGEGLTQPGLERWPEGAAALTLRGNAPGQVRVEGFDPAGGVTIGTRFNQPPLLLDDEGPGGLEPKVRAAIASTPYKQAFRSYLRVGLQGLRADELRTLQEGVDTGGGFLVPEDILALVIAKQPTPTQVAGRVTQLQTSRDALLIPKVNYAADDLYTTGMRVTWTQEAPASATTARVTDPVFGQVRIPVFTAMMSMPLTNDVVEDALFPIVAWSSAKFAETIDLLRDNMILNGSGVGQPAGILVNPGSPNNPAVITSGNASALTADGIQNIAWSLPPQYDAAAVWVFNKTSAGQAIATLKDANNRYLWGMGLQDSGLAPGYTNRLLVGYPVLFSGFMPNVGANNYPIIFGDLTGYYLLNRVGFSIQVLREVYAETNQIVLLGRIRFGGLVAEDWKLKIQQVHT